MKIDLYVKIVLTIIAIGVFIPMLANPPIIYKASAFGNNGMIVADDGYVYHLYGDKIRTCYVSKGNSTKCGSWSN